MQVLVAEDDELSRTLLVRILSEQYDVVAAADGRAAWESLGREDGPQLAVLDWQMPGMDGPEICRRLRASAETRPIYVLLLTATRKTTEDLVSGLQAGADDYLTKPCHPDELRARVAVGRRMLQLQERLAERVRELQQALGSVRRLEGLLPICAWCKRIRCDQDYWQELENYLGERAEVTFTHGVCPQCHDKQRAEAKAARGKVF
jgi:DNA-binding response OmpR family regulator